MGTRIHLYALPGFPLHVEDLMPQPLLARCAGGLSAQGYIPVVYDAGSVERLDLPELERYALESGSAEGGRWQRLTARRPARGLAALQSARIVNLLRESPNSPAPSLCLVQIRRHKDVSGARLLARALRGRWPEACVAVAGEFVDTYARALLAGAPEFDVACVGPAESVLAGLARSLGNHCDFERIPGLIYRLGSRLAVGSLGVRPLSPDFAPANYHPSIYSGLLDGGKIKLFVLPQSTGLNHTGHYRGAPVQHQVHVRDCRQLRVEMVQLHEMYGARVFHITGEHTPRDAVVQFAGECMTLPFELAYSRDTHVVEAGPDIAAALVQSGCQTVGFTLLTGSQRLLADFYGEDWTISGAESCLRAYRKQGCSIHANFIYPCPADDYHSRSETVRILRRCLPHSAHFELPALPPGSAWRQHAQDFGFEVRGKDLDRWVAEDPGAETCGRLPFAMPGRTAKTAAREFNELRAEIAEFGVQLAPGAAACLMARVSGSGVPFLEDLLGAVSTLDLARMHDTIEGFNARATAAIAAVDLNPDLSVRKAVGN